MHLFPPHFLPPTSSSLSSLYYFLGHLLKCIKCSVSTLNYKPDKAIDAVERFFWVYFWTIFEAIPVWLPSIIKFMNLLPLPLPPSGASSHAANQSPPRLADGLMVQFRERCTFSFVPPPSPKKWETTVGRIPLAFLLQAFSFFFSS